MSQPPKILVTGANGQLGKELKAWAGEHAGFDFIFLSREDLPIHHFDLLRQYMDTLRPDYCVNCAAYTAVDRAESEKDLAYLVNAEAVGVLAAVCADRGVKLIHISTDYVFPGNSSQPYRETDTTGPINVYGASKLLGEERCLEFNPAAIIIRTSWVYSEFGHNFVKTMLRLMKEREKINVVNDQVGAPTYAADLASAIMQIIGHGNWHPGIYHYSNAGRISWFEFAVAIKKFTGSSCQVDPIPTSAYPTPAKRPAFSLLDTSKLRNQYGIDSLPWERSLEKCLKNLHPG